MRDAGSLQCFISLAANSCLLQQCSLPQVLEINEEDGLNE